MDSITASNLRTDGEHRMAKILLINLPHDCCSHELREWVESLGIEVASSRIILDPLTGVDPAFGYVELKQPEFLNAGASFLNGRIFRSNKITAKPVEIVPRDCICTASTKESNLLNRPS